MVNPVGLGGAKSLPHPTHTKKIKGGQHDNMLAAFDYESGQVGLLLATAKAHTFPRTLADKAQT